MYKIQVGGHVYGRSLMATLTGIVVDTDSNLNGYLSVEVSHVKPNDPTTTSPPVSLHHCGGSVKSGNGWYFREEQLTLCKNTIVNRILSDL